MHMTPESTVLYKTSIDVLIKLDAHRLLICNDCADKNKKPKFS